MRIRIEVGIQKFSLKTQNKKRKVFSRLFTRSLTAYKHTKAIRFNCTVNAMTRDGFSFRQSLDIG